jgi:hypothetical protein
VKKYLLVALAVLAFAIPGVAQQITPPVGEVGHIQGGVYYAPAYASWRSQVVSGNTTTGAGSTIVVTLPGALPDGYTIPLTSLFPSAAPFVPVAIVDANSETFTPTAVSYAACPQGTAGPIGSQCATLTGTIANTHGASALVTSGDSGIMEAITDAATAGGGLVFWITDTGVVTLNTGALTTTTTTKIPTQYYSLGVAARVTTTITTSANWAVGSAASGTAFTSVNATLTAGTTALANIQTSTALTGTTNALQAVVFTMGTSNPGAGAIKARVWGYTPVQSNN